MALISLGVTLAQWDEYGIGLLLFASASLVLFLKAYHWTGIEGQPKAGNVSKSILMIGAVIMVLAFVAVIIVRKGDKPWSFFVAALHAKLIPPPAPSAPKPPKDALFVPNDASTSHKSATSGAPKRENRPAFSVDIEHRMFTLPGPFDTSFWFGSFFREKCSLQPVQAALFLRITNLQSHKEMITAYSLNPLIRLRPTQGRIFMIQKKGVLHPSQASGDVIDFGSPAGLGMLLEFPIKDTDPKVSMPMTGMFLDNTLVEKYLEPYKPVRGWAFFRYPPGGAFPMNLTMTITDALQQSYSVPIPDHHGDPNGDNLPRTMVRGPTEDLSHCTISD